MTVVATPRERHVCTPGYEVRTAPRDEYLDGLRIVTAGTRYWHDLQLPPDTVVRCICGRTWVGFQKYANVVTTSWRREGRLERWFRERRERRAPS